MPEVIDQQDAQYALDIVRKICAEVGPGLPASPQERARGEVLRKELELHLGVEHAVTEEFTLAPDAFLSTHIAVFFSLAAILLNLAVGSLTGISQWIISLAALIFSLFMPVMFVIEFLLCRELSDPFFPQKQSTNVLGTIRRPGTKEVKRLLIVSGHHDSAPENTWLRYIGIGFYPFSAIYFIGMILLVVMCLIQLIGLVIGNEILVNMGTLKWFLLIFPIGPSLIYLAFFTRGKKNGGIVPGAADNLSASAAAVAMCRFLVKNPSYIPEDTEIRFISFGSEEAGCRGSKRYVKRHLDELKRLDARVLNYEIIADPEISILATDTNFIVKYSPVIVKSAVAAAQRAGVPYKISMGGGCDAMAFHQAGLKAITLQPMKLPQQMYAFYHQDRDTPEVLTIEPLLNALKLTLEWIRCGGE